jgi:ABC-type arginine/histidine transport system permease subunit
VGSEWKVIDLEASGREQDPTLLTMSVRLRLSSVQTSSIRLTRIGVLGTLVVTISSIVLTVIMAIRSSETSVLASAQEPHCVISQTTEFLIQCQFTYYALCVMIRSRRETD